MRLAWSGFAMLALACHAPASRAQANPPEPIGELPPVGYGTLNQDDVSLRLTGDEIEVRFLPLDERVLRLLGNDAYSSLHQLVASKKTAIDSVSRAAGISNPGLVLITFFGLRQDARFDPQDVSVTVRNRLYRPLGIVPYTANFTAHQLAVRQQATAIYIFEEAIAVYEPITLSYAGATTDGWKDVLQVIERERARVAGRARREGNDTTKKP